MRSRFLALSGWECASSPVLGANGLLYITGSDRAIHALNAVTGTPRWAGLPGFVSLYASPAIGADGAVYGLADSGMTFALDGTTGEVKWTAPGLRGLRRRTSSPAVGSNGRLYVVGKDNKGLCAFDAGTGALLWTFPTAGEIWSSAAHAADDTLFFGSDDGKLRALEGSTGRLRWQRDLGAVIWSSPALAGDGTVYVGCEDGCLHALDSVTGVSRWAVPCGSPVWSSPVIGPDGTVYAAATDGTVIAVEGSAPPAYDDADITAVIRSETGSSGRAAQGPLRIHPTNPRYFTDGTTNRNGFVKAVYLTGSHTWASLPDIGLTAPPPAFDFTAYVDSLERHHHTFIRLWRWELPQWNEKGSSRSSYCVPQPWPRTGPGRSPDGLSDVRLIVLRCILRDMADESDQALICAYSRTRCERSFGHLVHRCVGLVHSTAVRIVRDPSLAEDVTQRVFLALAQHSLKLQGRSSLTGWLHGTARNLAINTVRSEERRRHREEEAAAMKHLDADDSPAQWEQIAPFLDGSLSLLSAAEREVILWRYFERQTAGQIGGRLGLTAEAAQKRVARALDRLRGILTQRGLNAPAAAIAAVLSAEAVQPAPAGLAASVIAGASTASAVLPTTTTLQTIMASTKAKIALAAVLAASVTTPLVLQHQQTSRLANELAALRQQGPELDRLRAEVERLTAEAQSSAKTRGTERVELNRLRGELTTLKEGATRPGGAQKATLTVSPQKQAEASKPNEATLVRAEELKNVGFQTPALTVQTLAWAKVNGDTNVVANGLAWADEESRAQIEALFAAAPESVRERYGSADAYILSLFKHTGPTDDRHTLTSYRILTENVAGDEAVLTAEYNYADGSSYTSAHLYVRIGYDWRQTLDFDAPSQGKLGASLQAEGSTAEPSPDEQ